MHNTTKTVVLGTNTANRTLSIANTKAANDEYKIRDGIWDVLV